eukprot:gnl/TRDRNA2_/TRDRNA2_171758_c0_seq3.p2 gnl/TRDRNA2_/TRDRNA2_171758_c0~~gnl/TRDRNA2_/TRDRNA2_171758_c0_seq3.p2  ORF type:complete len:139 (-),score=21.25 gnl/TRDRNA2_/TRDRNA2_171758_c0_seq3:3-419(-)
MHPSQVKQYDGLLSMWARKGDTKSIVDFAMMVQGDSAMAGPKFEDSEIQAMSLQDRSPVHLYYTDVDEVWPATVTDAVDPGSNYDNIVTGWERYAPTPEEFTTTMFPGLSHGEMGAPDTPAFAHMMDDLSRIIATESL